jgi:transcriptional regulator with XRE-family HTH domain
MKNNNQLGELVKHRRTALALTQRSLGRKAGVAASHIALIENGQRKPSLKLVAPLADILGIDRPSFLVLAYPETKGCFAQANMEEPLSVTPFWKRFINNDGLLAQYHVTDRELQALKPLSLLGTVHSAKEFLAILMLVRDIPSNK